jgi:hypothetical protein
MSHFTKIEVRFDSLEALKDALKQMGYSVIEGRHTMRNRWNDSREVDLEVAELRSQVGFTQNQDGTIEMHADWYGLGINHNEFTQQLTQLHSKYKTLDSLRRDGWKLVKETVADDGKIQLQVRRWVS